MCILITAINISDSSKADILSLAAYKLAADNTAILCIAANIRSGAFGVLSTSITAYILVMSRAAVSACHNDFAAMKGSVELFQLVYQFAGNQNVMGTAAFASKFSYIKMSR